MDRVAAKIAEEVGVLFKHDRVDAGASEQKTEHHPGRAAARDDAARVQTRLRLARVHAAHVP